MSDIEQIIDQYCEKRQREESLARDNSKFRVSDAGRCRLMRYWKRQGKEYEQKNIPLPVYRTMQAGVLLHGWIEHILHESAGDKILSVETEGEVEDEHRLGHFDILLRLKDNSSVLVEVKTVKDKQFYWKKQKGADKAHLFQICSYASMLPKFPDNLSIYYLNRDSMELLEVRVNPKTIQRDVTEDWNILETSWINRFEPTRNPESWECRYCMYDNNCPYSIKQRRRV